MEFDKINNEEIIYDKGDWKASRDSNLGGIIWIYKANYDSGHYLVYGYVHHGDNFVSGDMSEDMPEDLENLLLREVI